MAFRIFLLLLSADMRNNRRHQSPKQAKGEANSVTTSRASMSKLGAGRKRSACVHISTATLNVLHFFRWFVPRNQRENVDIVISELKEDIQDMRKEQKSWAFIQLLVTWHSVRAIGAHVLDSASRIAKKLNPIASIFEKED